MVDNSPAPHRIPKILAPAGNQESFLAALAAGADAVYCGLKVLSARMEAANFTLEQMAALTRLAHDRGTEVHLALNTILKPDEIPLTCKLLAQIRTHIDPDGIILQDPGCIPLVRQAGLGKRIHLSTLANVTFPQALPLLHRRWGIRRVVLPRELNIDEIRAMACACPPGMDLEVFIHGALCYAVSGRCYWSSYLGGKSGLRGRCVQPCRRKYVAGKSEGSFFNCRDLSLDVLVKVLAAIPQVGVWKIEGRKKGPHYVYHVVSAYRRLRDHGQDPQAKKEALGLLEYALGRPGSHYTFLPQRPYLPVGGKLPSGSGLLVGRTQGSGRSAYIQPRLALYPEDRLRIGYEDHAWHRVLSVSRSVPLKGRLYLSLPAGKQPPKGTPVFLIDRRDPSLKADLKTLESKLTPVHISTTPPPMKRVRTPKSQRLRKGSPVEIQVMRSAPAALLKGSWGVWVMEAQLEHMPAKSAARVWWWLPPVVWPGETDHVKRKIAEIVSLGGRRFVLNAPWQMAWFQAARGMVCWAGPFCNIGNGSAVEVMQAMGFKGVILSPELGKSDYLRLPEQSPLPLGIVLRGNWPLALSRIAPADLRSGQPFVSPQKETGWIAAYGSTQWLYPNWPVDLRPAEKLLVQAGYQQFVTLAEPIPRAVRIKPRPGFWNWSIGLK